MLLLEIPETEFYDEVNNEFIYTDPIVLRLEHSLVSISKWETKWRKPFLTKTPKTDAETRDYIRCMTLNQHVDQKVYRSLTADMIKKVNDYINLELTATTFSDNKKVIPSREVVTSEVIYYMMCAYQIPWEAQKWHLSRLLTLIRIANIKNSPDKKMSKSEIMRRNRELNEARKKRLGTRG